MNNINNFTFSTQKKYEPSDSHSFRLFDFQIRTNLPGERQRRHHELASIFQNEFDRPVGLHRDRFRFLQIVRAKRSFHHFLRLLAIRIIRFQHEEKAEENKHREEPDQHHIQSHVLLFMQHITQPLSHHPSRLRRKRRHRHRFHHPLLRLFRFLY